MTSVIVSKHFTSSNLSFDAPRIQPNKTYLGNINYDGESFNLQTPKLSFCSWTKLPSEIMLSAGDKGGTSLYELLREVNRTIVTSTTNSCMEWFGKSIPDFAIEKMLRNQIVLPEKSTDGLKMMFNVCPNVDTYDKDKRPVDLSTVPEGSKVILLLRCNGLTFRGTSLECDWVTTQVKVYFPSPVREKKCLIQDDEPTGFESETPEGEDYYNFEAPKVPEESVSASEEAVSEASTISE